MNSSGEFPGPLMSEAMSAAAVPETTATPAAPTATYADVGARVARIITAAEEASAEIRADALAGAEQIRAEARDRADRHVAERTLDGQRIVAEAEEGARGITSAADAYATLCRHDAEEEAERIVTEAEAQAFEHVQAAQREAEPGRRGVEDSSRGARARGQGAGGAPGACPRPVARHRLAALRGRAKGRLSPRHPAVRTAMPPAISRSSIRTNP